MNIYKFFFFWSLWACLFYSCTDPILDSAFEEYTPPEISITKNEQSGSEVTINWQADNPFALEFSYMLEPLEQEWSAWNADTSAYYNHLDENDYIFKVKCRYEEGSEQEIPDSVLFTINNIAGPGLRFFPQDCVFSPKIGHFAWLASSFSRRSTIDRSCIARRLDVRLTNGRRRMPSLVVGGGVRARKPPSAPSRAR